MKLQKPQMNKSFLSSTLIVIYVIVTVVIIGFFVIREQKERWEQEAFENGQQILIQGILQDAASCTPIPVFNEETQVDLIDINCFQVEQGQESGQDSTGE